MTCAMSLTSVKKGCASPTSLSLPQPSMSSGNTGVETAGDGDRCSGRPRRSVRASPCSKHSTVLAGAASFSVES